MRRAILKVGQQSKLEEEDFNYLCFGLGPTHGGGSYIYLYSRLLCAGSTHQPIFVALAMGVQEGKD